MSEINVITPASVTDLVQMINLIEDLGLTTYDPNVLQRAIRSASAAVRSYCDRTFAQERVTERFSGDEVQEQIYLSRVPVTTLHEVTDSLGATVNATAYRLENFATGLFRQTLIRRSTLASDAWPEITVEYTGGYLLPGEAGRTLPEDIERAAAEMARAIYLRRTRDPQVISETIGDYSYRTSAGGEMANGVPMDVAGLLDPYRRRAVG